MTNNPEIRYKSKREFGRGTLFGDRGDNFFDLDIKKRVRQMAWSHACPVVDQVAAEFGPDWTEKRYAECNMVFGIILEEAQKNNPRLALNLSKSVERDDGEYASEKLNGHNIPCTFWGEMSPLSTPYGYALPRVLIEQFGRGENNINRTSKRILKGLNLLDKEIKKNDDPIELLIALAKGVVKMDADPKEVIGHVLAKSVLLEEGCANMYLDIYCEMKDKARGLWGIYKKMLNDKKWQGVIIRPEDLK